MALFRQITCFFPSIIQWFWWRMAFEKQYGHVLEVLYSLVSLRSECNLNLNARLGCDRMLRLTIEFVDSKKFKDKGLQNSCSTYYASNRQISKITASLKIAQE